MNFSFRLLSHIKADRIQTFVGKCLEKKKVLTPNVFYTKRVPQIILRNIILGKLFKEKAVSTDLPNTKLLIYLLVLRPWLILLIKNDIRDVGSTAEFADLSDFAVFLCFFFDFLILFFHSSE